MAGVLVATASIAEAATITVCYTSWKPYSYTVKGQPDGLSVTLTRKAAAAAGIDVRFAELPWLRCLNEVRRGDTTAALDGSPTRAEFIHGDHSVVQTVTVLVVRANSPLQSIVRVEDLRGLQIAVPRGYVFDSEVTARLSSQFIYAEEGADRLAMVLGNRVDGYLTNVFAAREESARAPVRPLNPPLVRSSLYTLFRPDHDELMRTLDAGYAAILADGTVERTYQDKVGISYSELIDLGVLSPTP